MRPSVLRDIRLSAEHEGRLVIADPSPIAVLLVMPTILILFLKNGLLPPSVGAHSALNGTAQAVPGIGTMFAFMLVGYAGLAFFREHGWRTWERLRVSPLSTHGVVIGKSIPYLVLGIVQLLVLFGVGFSLLDLEVRGSFAAIAVLMVLVSMSAVSLAVLLTAFTRSIQHLYALSNIAAVLLGGIGGAFAPPTSYPEWAQLVARVTPQYWAIDGFKQVIVGGAHLDGIVANAAALLAFSVAFLAVASFRFDTTEVKQSFLD